jgi:uncharacterized protein YndB with AHSA1/START domain
MKISEEDRQKTPLIVERIVNAPVARVWKAITDEVQLRRWFFNVDRFKPEIGFEFQFDGAKEGICYRHLCRVTEVVVGKKLTYSWRYEGFAGNSFVTLELFPAGDSTRIKVTHQGLETLPMTEPGFLNGTYVPDWATIIGMSLTAFLEQ